MYCFIIQQIKYTSIIKQCCIYYTYQIEPYIPLNEWIYILHGLSVYYIPELRIKYTFDIIPALGVYVFAGPTLSLGLAANTKISFTGEALGNTMTFDARYNSYTGKIKSENIPEESLDQINRYLPQTRMNRFDVLMGGGIGLNLVKFVTVKGGFDYGLLNRFNEDMADAGTLNRMQFYISVGVMF